MMYVFPLTSFNQFEQETLTANCFSCSVCAKQMQQNATKQSHTFCVTGSEVTVDCQCAEYVPVTLGAATGATAKILTSLLNQKLLNVNAQCPQHSF